MTGRPKHRWPAPETFIAWSRIHPNLVELQANELPHIPYRTILAHLRYKTYWPEMKANFDEQHEDARNASRAATMEARSRVADEEFPNRVYRYLKDPRRRGGIHLGDLADVLDVSPKRVREALEDLEDEGKSLHRIGDVVSAHVLAGAENRIDLEIEPREKMYVGVISDTHFGSKKQQPSALYEFMHRAADEYPLDCFLHAGDVTDGIPEVYRGHTHEVWLSRADDQVDYVVHEYPDTGVPTSAIAGNHDESADKKAGKNVVAAIAKEREDIHYVDFYGGYVDAGGIAFYLWHPPGGAAYAKSYKLQRFVEGFGDSDKPHFVLAGHLHQYVHVWHRGVHAFLVPSFQSTTRFIRRLGYESMVGGIVLEIERDDDGDPVVVTPRLTRVDAKEHDYPGW